MADRHPNGFLRTIPTSWVTLLLGLHVAAALLTVVGTARNGVIDAYVLRAERIAASPATPYRHFPSAAMPLETAAFRLLGGNGATGTAVSFVLVSLAADLVVAGGLLWGWGRRPAVVYLLLALPLLSFLFLRLDLVSVALAVWSAALLRRREDLDLPAGGLFGLAVLWRLWPLALAPLFLFRRAWRAAAAAAGALLLGGAWWYLTGGPKGPFQVLTFRSAMGWSVEGTPGSVLRPFLGGPTSTDGTTVRFGTTSTREFAVLGVLLVTALALVWWRAARDEADPTGAPALAAVAALLAFAPVNALHYAIWLLPWTAVAFEGDERERGVATAAAAVIALDGVIAVLVGSEHAFPSGTAVELLLLVRNLLCLATVGIWIRPERRREPAGAHAAA